MGNCQAAEAAAAVIHHPNGRVERLHWSSTASQVMSTNPGYYVAFIIAVQVKSATDQKSERSKKVRYVKLLRPDDALLVGQVYMLVSYEDVLREFGSKRRVRLSRLLAKQKEAKEGEESRSSVDSSDTIEEQQEEEDVRGTFEGGVDGGSTGMMRQGQWRPTLQTIAEIGN